MNNKRQAQDTVCGERMKERRYALALKKGGGFSLVELMVAMSLGLFLIGGVVATYLAGNAASRDAAQLSRIQENIRFASDYLVRDMRNAGFSDEGELLLGIANQIRERYVDVLVSDASVPGRGDIVRVRYAGRGHCAEEFNTIRLVENEYSVVGGRLVCRGRQVGNSVPNDINEASFSNPVVLVDGVRRVSFERICPGNSASPCTCDLGDALDEACVGVRIAMEFDGPGATQRSVEFTAALRNVVFARMSAGFPSAGSGEED